MKALIDPTITNITYISEWVPNIDPVMWQYGKYRPIYETLPYSERVCEVSSDENIFPVAEPLFWTNCPNECAADFWYYDSSDLSCKIIPNVPAPKPPQ